MLLIYPTIEFHYPQHVCTFWHTMMQILTVSMPTISSLSHENGLLQIASLIPQSPFRSARNPSISFLNPKSQCGKLSQRYYQPTKEDLKCISVNQISWNVLPSTTTKNRLKVYSYPINVNCYRNTKV